VSFHRFQYPPPANWQDFESLCLALWREKLQDPATQKNGREGQSQNGVDVFGKIGSFWWGIQCKGRQNYPPGAITWRELVAETRKALRFRPSLHAFVLATTAQRDALIQRAARRISALTRLNSVMVFSWDDICEELALRPHLVSALFANNHDGLVRSNESGGASAIIVGGNIEAQVVCDELFASPEVQRVTREELRSDLRVAAMELCLNARGHGGAQQCEAEITPFSFEISDDGAPFDVMSAIGVGRFTGAGLLFLSHLLSKYREDVSATWTRDGSRNRFRLEFSAPLDAPQFSKRCLIILNDRVTGTRGSGLAAAMKAEFPAGCVQYFFHVRNRDFNASALMEFLTRITERIPSGSVLVVEFDQGDSSLLRQCALHGLNDGWLDRTRILIR